VAGMGAACKIKETGKSLSKSCLVGASCYGDCGLATGLWLQRLKDLCLPKDCPLLPLMFSLSKVLGIWMGLIFLEYHTHTHIHTHTHTHTTLYLLPQVLPHGSSPQGHCASRHPGKAPRVFPSHLAQQPSPSLKSVLPVHLHCHDLLCAPVISPLDSPAWPPVNSQLPWLAIHLPHCCGCKPPIFILRRLIYLLR